MRYNPAIYAKAFWEVKPDPARFLDIVKKNGDIGGAKKIIAAIAAAEAKALGAHVVNVEFAREMSEEAVQKVRRKFKEHDLVTVNITPALVAGVRITLDGEKELDQSLQRKLNKLWHTKS